LDERECESKIGKKGGERERDIDISKHQFADVPMHIVDNVVHIQDIVCRYLKTSL